MPERNALFGGDDLGVFFGLGSFAVDEDHLVFILEAQDAVAGAAQGALLASRQDAEHDFRRDSARACVLVGEQRGDHLRRQLGGALPQQLGCGISQTCFG